MDALNGFYAAEADHQDFVARYPQDQYVLLFSLPKIWKLNALLKDLYRP